VPKDSAGNDLFDLDIDTLEDKPWRRPGANMADYFNYGMNEAAWKNYASKQRRTREEESVAMNPFAVRSISFLSHFCSHTITHATLMI
jgi:pre-mRNA 3'-end-processing factor FIP1